MQRLLEWLVRLEGAPREDLKSHISRVFHTGHVPPPTQTDLLTFRSMGRLPSRPGDSGPESVSVLQFPDSLPLSEQTLQVGEELGVLLCLVTRRRTAVPLEIPISVEGSSTINFLPYGTTVDRELIGPLPDDALARLTEHLERIRSLTKDNGAVLGAAMKLHYGACILVEKDVRSAYVLLVAAIEVLSRSYGSPPSEWAEWEGGADWERIFVQLALTPDQQTVLRNELLRNRHLRLKRTFSHYASNTLPDSFWDLVWEQWSYTYHPPEDTWRGPVLTHVRLADVIPSNRRLLEKSLAKTYDTRSGYVHQGDQFDLSASIRNAHIPVTGEYPLPYQLLRLIAGELIMYEFTRNTSRTPIHIGQRKDYSP